MMQERIIRTSLLFYNLRRPMSWSSISRIVLPLRKRFHELTDEELDALEGLDALKQICNRQKKKFTVSVEGNIGCGKSTLLKYFEKYSNKVHTIREPIDKWTNLQGHNMLQLLYDDSKRWSFSFNNYCLLTRLEMHKAKPKLLYSDPKRWSFTFDNYSLLTRLDMHLCEASVPVKMLERSLYSTKYVFVENSYRGGLLTGLEYSVLTEWFEHLVTAHKDIAVDLFVYLRAPADVCYDRIKKRNRKEEAGVPFEFIESLHMLHEEWLMEKKFPVSAPVLILDASQDLPQMKQVYEKHKSEILFGCA